MVRTQVQLPEEQYEKLKRAAARANVSMAEVIRLSVDHYLRDVDGMAAKRARALAALDVMDTMEPRGDGAADVSVNHDQYLADWLYENLH